MRDLTLRAAEFEALAAGILQGGSGLRFRARGASMRPFIRDGDVLELQPLDGAPVRRGDVVLFREGAGRVVAHRVIHLRREDGRVVLRTRGDALACPDGFVSREQVLGRVVALERGGRRIGLDRTTQRLLGVLWLGTSPLGGWLYRALAALRRRVLPMSPAR
jgi:signal peptidase